MISYSDGRIAVIGQDPDYKAVRPAFTEAQAQYALRFHQSLPGYRQTELVSLAGIARERGVDSVFVKDESARFGLKAFKGLGGSYSMFRILCDLFSLDYRSADYATFLDPSIRERCGGVEFVTATDGNHGKGVSWAARLFGCKAHVYMPKGSVEARRRAIEDVGAADAQITDMNYDQTVQLAASLAEKNGWILIQDTAWDGYEQIPTWIIEGYLTLIQEAVSQLRGKTPTHIFLQAGVGALAGGMESYLLDRFRGKEPILAVVEPEAAACVYRSALAGDGLPHTVGGDPETIMAGLNCGTPCKIVWPTLRDGSSFFCACADSVAELGMRAYAHPLGADRAVVSGESGAVTYGLLLSILQSEKLRELFRIGSDSVVLLINTEGDTDPDGYARIIGHAVRRDAR